MPLPERKRARRGRSEGSIYLRKDGLWVGCVSLGVHAGRRVRRTVYGHTKAEAAEELRKLQTRSDAGQLDDAGSITIEAWLERWLTLIESNIEPGSHEPYRIHARKHISPRIGGVRVQRLRPVDVESFYVRCLRDGVSASYVRKLGTTLSVAMNHAVRSQLIPSNPCRGVKRPRAEKHRIEVLDAAQVSALVAACKTDRLGPLFLLMLDSGVRPGEALALTWKDIDFAAGRISVTKALTSKGKIKRPKTERSNRTIDLTPATMTALHGHRKAMLAEGRDVRRGQVFVSGTGGAIIPNKLTRDYLRPLLVAAKLPAVGAYALRHTCATMLLAAGINPKIVSERLGHSSIAITLDTYSHVMPGMQRGAVDALAKALGG